MNDQTTKSRVILAAALLLLTFVVRSSAQDANLARWQALRVRQPDGVSLAISAAKSEFYAGELIPLQLSFTSTQSKGFIADTRLQDRVGRMNGVEEFLVDPAALIEDPLHGLPGENGGMGGLSGGPIPLSEKPFAFERLLNEWVRFRKPGKYRIAILSRRVTQVTDPSLSEFSLRMRPRGNTVELVSNILAIEIVPAPAVWVRDQIADAVRVLDRPQGEDMRERRLRAGQTLRFLDSPQAALELVRQLGSGDDVDSWALHMGVLGSPYGKQLLPAMEARLTAPDQPVWGRYLDTLSSLSEMVAPGEGVDRRRKQYAARLIASLSAKRPEARVTSMNTLLNSDAADPAWLPAVASLLIADFRALPSRMQSELLSGRWNVIGGPAMLPILREIQARPPEPGLDPALRDIAVRRIYELEPEEGRRIILSEMARGNSYLSTATLAILPDRSLPELNDALATRLEAHQFPDSLILRYATGDIVARVEQAYLKRNEEQDRQKLPHCGGILIFYFLQHDPAFGERELRNQMDRPGAPPACYDIGFQFLALDANAYSPALERLAIEFLSSPKVPVKRGAAEVLGKYGSPAAEKPLWDTLEYFRSWWKGREEQLDEANGQESLQFERALRIALARADGWTLQDDGLNRLLSLCSSGWCRQEVQEWLSQAVPPIALGISPGDEFRATVGGYENRSVEQLRRKIRQFPADTVFRLVPAASKAKLDEAREIVRSEGYSLEH